MNTLTKELHALPDELFNYIVWLSSGPINLDIYNKKKDINEELAHYKSMRDKFDINGGWDICNCKKYGKDGIYLTSVTDDIHPINLSFAYRIGERKKRKMMEYFRNMIQVSTFEKAGLLGYYNKT
tara:strand:- start:2618 stop:2992 length:375 start_codon:yes stop_codon:yes gene_type:complete